MNHNYLWKGPHVDGITQSMMTAFQQCPYRFYLYYCLGLMEDKPLDANLIWGDVFHKGMEHIIKGDGLNSAIEQMHAYREFKHATAPVTYQTSTERMLRRFAQNAKDHYEGEWTTEQVFTIPYTLPGGSEVTLRGKVDAICTSHSEYERCLGEHKCKGYIDRAKTERELGQDLQVNFYLYLHNLEWVKYDLILIPESVKYAPAKSYSESPSVYMDRLFTGPCGNYNIFPINANIHQWMHHIVKYVSRESQEQYWNQTIVPRMLRMVEFWERVNCPSFDPTNLMCYDAVFYKNPAREFVASNTEKFECQYYTHLLGEEDLSSLVPVPRLYQELTSE